jgi:hypothetical protein
MSIPYISRPQAAAFLRSVLQAFDQPAQNPVVYQVWGIGGVGKSKLLRKLIEQSTPLAIPLKGGEVLSFGRTEHINTPIEFMKTVHDALQTCYPKPPLLQRKDAFAEHYSQYFDALHQLQTQPVSGKGDVTTDQLNAVKKLTSQAATLGSQLVPLTAAIPGSGVVAGKVAEGLVDGASLIASKWDQVKQLVMAHQALKGKRELQELLLNPVAKLTDAWVEALIAWSKQKRLVLLLDTYEKAPLEIDTWLSRTLLGNHDLRSHRVRVVIAGRHCLLKTEEWRKLHQDTHCVDERTIERFDVEQTQAYLHEIGLTDATQVQAIFRITKGLPYYLNWIREEYQKGQEPNFSQGNDEIVRLLLQGLNDTQQRVLQLAACPRWFDPSLIYALMEQQKLDFDTAVDPQCNTYQWLIQQSFVEPVQNHFRLDDVARDTFRQAFWRSNPSGFEQTHTQLALYFKSLSDRDVAPTSPPPTRYQNPTWRDLRSEYLYHLLWTRRDDLQRQVVSHLLEARYFQQDRVVQNPVETVLTESNIDNNHS